MALCELIKNSYDADASQCDVTIATSDNGDVVVTVRDNGMGMSVRDIENYWMRIGTTHKLHKPLSPLYGRIRTGRKGIGRFCCRKLGRLLDIETVTGTASTFTRTQLSLDWGDFKAGSPVEKVTIHGTTFSSKKFSKGTTLTITGKTASEWTDKNLDYIRRQLSVLVANQGSRRDGFKDDPGFSVSLMVDGKSQDVEDLRDELIDAGWGTLTARVDEKGKAVYTLNAKGLKKTHKSEAIYKQICGAFLRIGIIPLQKAQFRKPSILSLEKARDIYENWSGVQVKHNGFRVFPYGSVNDDWLFIDRDRARRLGKPRKGLLGIAEKHVEDPKRVLLNSLSNRNYFGSVSVDSSIKGLEMKADRMGFIDSDSLEQLRDMIRVGIDWSTIMREHWLEKKAWEEREELNRAFIESLEEKETSNTLDTGKISVAERAIDLIEEKLVATQGLLPPEDRDETRQLSAKAIEILRTTSTENEKALHKYRVMVSAASITLIFAHEVRSVLGLLNETAHQIKAFEKLNPSVFDGDKVSLPDRLQATTERFDELLNLANIVALPSDSEEKKGLNLRTNIEKAIKVYDLIATAYKISIDVSVIEPWNLKTKPIYRSELLAILINALSNSIKAVIACKKRKKIAISATRIGKSIRISVRDTGIGIDKQFYEEAFTELVSDPQRNMYTSLAKNLNPSDKAILGSGSGFGLSIIRSLAEINGGSANFVKPPKGWSTELQITLS